MGTKIYVFDSSCIIWLWAVLKGRGEECVGGVSMFGSALWLGRRKSETKGKSERVNGIVTVGQEYPRAMKVEIMCWPTGEVFWYGRCGGESEDGDFENDDDEVGGPFARWRLGGSHLTPFRHFWSRKKSWQKTLGKKRLIPFSGES